MYGTACIHGGLPGNAVAHTPPTEADWRARVRKARCVQSRSSLGPEHTAAFPGTPTPRCEMACVYVLCGFLQGGVSVCAHPSVGS